MMLHYHSGKRSGRDSSGFRCLTTQWIQGGDGIGWNGMTPPGTHMHCACLSQCWQLVKSQSMGQPGHSLASSRLTSRWKAELHGNVETTVQERSWVKKPHRTVSAPSQETTTPTQLKNSKPLFLSPKLFQGYIRVLGYSFCSLITVYVPRKPPPASP